MMSALMLLATWTWTATSADSKPAAPVEIDKDHAAKMAKGLDIFKKQVRPVLTQHCLKCHGGKKTEGEFDLADREGLLRGGASGQAIIVGRGRDSLLYKLVTHGKNPKMPFQSKKLPDEAIASIATWIDLGAPYDESLVPGKSKTAWTQTVVAAEARQHWAFQPLWRGEPPVPSQARPPGGRAWDRNPIDRFVLAKLEQAGIAPNPPAAKRQLIRRAYYDLLGLPPTPEEVEAFLNDSSPEAFGKVIDKLLDSPHYGERWARHWLDLVRFAESHGFEHDYDRPTAYHYRDFVIKALNQGMPYDTFVKWQLAGDEYDPDNYLAMMATGYLAAGVHSTQITKNEVEKHRYDELDDMLATTGTAMLGLTIGCARCHDHKYDPIPQRDYYRMLSTFTTTVRSELDLNLDPAGYKQAKAAFDKEHAPYEDVVKKFEADWLPARKAGLEQAWFTSPDQARWLIVDGFLPRGLKSAGLVRWAATSDPEWLRLVSAAQTHLKKAPKPNVVKALISSEGLAPVRLHTQGEDFLKETHFLGRGDPNQKVAVATQSYLQVLMPASDADNRWQPTPPSGSRTSHRRTAFAEWLTDVDHGGGRLLARVIVNRLWHYHLGRGLVATPSDFGLRGEKPSHPELLDWLATELIRNGWKLKPIHKLIMTSAVYQQSSYLDESKLKADRDNRLCWRRPTRRLEAEVIRDALLYASGSLDPKMFGPGTLDESSRRRSIYFTVKRSKLMPMMTVFDSPDALSGIGDRPTTTIAPQALLLMNNPQVRLYAKNLARRLAPDAKTPVEDAIKAGYLFTVSRPPTPEELADAVAFINQQMESYKAAGKSDARELALADFGQVLMCLNEFVYVE